MHSFIAHIVTRSKAWYNSAFNNVKLRTYFFIDSMSLDYSMFFNGKIRRLTKVIFPTCEFNSSSSSSNSCHLFACILSHSISRLYYCVQVLLIFQHLKSIINSIDVSINQIKSQKLFHVIHGNFSFHGNFKV